MIRILKYGEVPNSEIFMRNMPTVDVSDTVAEIIRNVRERGDEALREYTERHRTSPVHVLAEEEEDGMWLGHTEHYVEVRFTAPHAAVGEIAEVVLMETDGEICVGKTAE